MIDRFIMSNKAVLALAVVGVLIVLALMGKGKYNSMITLDEKVETGWSTNSGIPGQATEDQQKQGAKKN